MKYGLDALKKDMPQLVRRYLTTGRHPAMTKEEHKIFMNCVELFRSIGIPIEQVDDSTLRQLCLFDL